MAFLKQKQFSLSFANKVVSTSARLHPFGDAQTQFKRGVKDKIKVAKHLGKGIRDVWEGFGKFWKTFFSNFNLGLR